MHVPRSSPARRFGVVTAAIFAAGVAPGCGSYRRRRLCLDRREPVDWITVTQGESGTGTGTVRISVRANAGARRTGTLTAAG
jgi:hypothetical protein